METKKTADKATWMTNITTLALLLLSFAVMYNMAKQIVDLVLLAAGI
jgi:hypothetical protein